MKLTLIFLLCFVSATYQHPQYHPSNYRIFYEPRWALFFSLQTNQQSFIHDYVIQMISTTQMSFRLIYRKFTLLIFLFFYAGLWQRGRLLVQVSHVVVVYYRLNTFACMLLTSYFTFRLLHFRMLFWSQAVLKLK